MSVLALVLVALSVAALSAAALKFDVPKGWVSKTPSSTMRVAEFTLAKAAGDAEDATVTVYFFGGQGGSVQANLDRWMTASDRIAELFYKADSVNTDRKQTVLVSFLALQSAMR